MYINNEIQSCSASPQFLLVTELHVLRSVEYATVHDGSGIFLTKCRRKNAAYCCVTVKTHAQLFVGGVHGCFLLHVAQLNSGVRAQGRRHNIIKSRTVYKFNSKKLNFQTKYLTDASQPFSAASVLPCIFTSSDTLHATQDSSGNIFNRLCRNCLALYGKHVWFGNTVE